MVVVIQNPVMLACGSVGMTSPLGHLMELIFHDRQELLTCHLYITDSSRVLNLMNMSPC
jgi:hypothetical protein